MKRYVQEFANDEMHLTTVECKAEIIRILQAYK